ncbi:MAG: hypothetical protein KJ970_16260, partial [Candidatus Eisenbacteria bacterium]|nr:hypothetical protein [Candidatus Eisenbacteria bacterium]
MPHCVRSKTFISSAIALLLLLIAAGAFTQSPGPLSSTHEFLDDSGSCDICHGNNPSDDEASQDESCLTCHDGIAWLIAQQRGFHAEYSEGCGGCHVEHEGPDARLIDPDLVDPKGFDHNDTGWPLGETHADLSCSDCHQDQHQVSPVLNMEPGSSPDGSFLGLENRCTACHAEDEISPGLISATHAHLDCRNCHSEGASIEQACLACHQGIDHLIKAERGFHAEYSEGCAACHTEHEGRDALLIDPDFVDPGAFDHSDTGWEFQGRHSELECTACHRDNFRRSPVMKLRPTVEAGETFLGLETTCVNCHINPHGDRFNTPLDKKDCTICHSFTAFRPARIDAMLHATFPFPLVGAHQALPCFDCHTELRLPRLATTLHNESDPPPSLLFAKTHASCSDCHEDQHGGRFSSDCSQCHGADRFHPVARFDHAEATGFALEGAHADLECATCHSSKDLFQGDLACVSCHQDVHRGEFGTACALCHSSRGFQDPSTFARAHRETRFPLTGAHTTVACDACHGSPGGEELNYVLTPVDCEACHLAEYDATGDPDHGKAGFPHDCSECHTPSEWASAVFDHSFFDLSGGHAAPTCAQCHSAGIYEGMPDECYACHQADYEGTSDPDHAAAGFPTHCTICHDPTRWDNGAFDHSFFDLSGGHAAASCAQCHGGGLYEGTPTECYTCHEADYEETSDPDHAAAGFSTDCTHCHDLSRWDNGAFDHSFFDLSGGHASPTCAECHLNGVYEGISNTCIACHHTDYENTEEPDHAEAGFPTDCRICHDPTNWENGEFNHAFFDLSGGHAAASCAQCHGGGVYAGTPTECYTCHETDYAEASDPDHTAAGFSTDCTHCHDL